MKRILFLLKKVAKNSLTKYILVLIGFLIWLIFLDSNNLISQYQLNAEYQEQINLKEYYIREIEKNTKQIYLLKNNREYIEKYGRENFLMKKNNEDIFLFVDPPKK